MMDTRKTLKDYTIDEVVKLMIEPLPGAAFKKHPSKSFLTTISPDYTRERLTKVFGLYGVGWGLTWKPENTKIWTSETSKGKEWWNFALLQAEFWFRLDNDIVSYPVTGYSSNDNLGDAMEGARTNAVSAGTKQLLFQIHIFKDTSPVSFFDKEENETIIETTPNPKPQNHQPTNVSQPPKQKPAPTPQPANDEPKQKSDPWPAKSGKVADFCNQVRRLTGDPDLNGTGYYTSQFHLNNALKDGFGDLSNPSVFDAKVVEAIAHAKQGADEEAAKTE